MMSTDGVEGGHEPQPAGGPVRTCFSAKVNRDERGLCCRGCGCRDLAVVYTRDRIGGRRRKRKCRNCGEEMCTMERLPAS